MAGPAVYEDFNFIVNWGGASQPMMSVSPLVRSNDVLEYRDGNEKLNSPHKAPGITRYEPIVLERRLQPGNTDFYDWAQLVTVVSGNYTDALRELTIQLLDGQMNPVVTFRVTNCWPSSYEISGLNGDGSAFVVERLTLEYDTWIWDEAGTGASGTAGTTGTTGTSGTTGTTGTTGTITGGPQTHGGDPGATLSSA